MHLRMKTPLVQNLSAKLGILYACVALHFAVLPARATTVIAPSFTQLVRQADYIVRATVKAVTSEMRTDGAHQHIVTKVELEVHEVISGTPPQPLVLLMLGGKVGAEEMVVDGAPRFKLGDEDILFVRGNGRQISPLVGMMHGRYPITREAGTGREFMTRSNGTPLTSEEDVARPMAGSISTAATPGAPAGPTHPALSPAEFITRIKAAATQINRAKLEN